MFSINAAKLFGLEKLVSGGWRATARTAAPNPAVGTGAVPALRNYSENFRLPSFTTACHILISSAIR